MKVNALHLGKRINLRDLQDKIGFKAGYRDPLVYEYSKKKYVATLKYGVLVFWGFSQGEINHFISLVNPFLSEKFAKPFEEEVEVLSPRVRDEVRGNEINFKSMTIEKIALVSLVLGRSVALDYYDKEVEKVLTEFDPLMKSFEEKGGTALSTRSLIKLIGFAMNLRHLTATQMAFLDKPELAWNDPSLDKFYNQLAENYEIDDRYEILDDKLESIFRNVEFILDYLNTRRSLKLEIIIVALILLEVVLFVLQVIVGF